MEEITLDINELRIIDPFTFKYITVNLIDLSTLKFKLNSKFYYPSTYKKYYKETFYTISTTKYLQMLQKIFNKNINICLSCKKNILLDKYCCNLCHEWFCTSCCELHKEEDSKHEKNLSDIKLDIKYSVLLDEEIKKMEIEKLKKKLFKMKFLCENDFQKNWEICECENGGGRVTCYCKHGLKCENCKFDYAQVCNDCIMEPNKELRFFYLDVFFLKTELKYYDEIKILQKDIDNFNNNIANLFNENINNISNNKTRAKRFRKHFNDLRYNFIAYQKLKLISINQLKKDQNYNLIQLFKKMKYFKICFKRYKYNEKLTKDENISKISNFFATQKPIYFYNYIRERSIKNIEKKSNISEQNNIISNKIEYQKKEYPEASFKIRTDTYSRNEDIEYYKLLEVFKFNSSIYGNMNYYDDSKKFYYLKFKEKDINIKLEILSNASWCINSKFLIKLSDLKYLIHIYFDYYYNNNYHNWIFIANLVDEIDIIYELDFIFDSKDLTEIIELEKKQKYLFYKIDKYSHLNNNKIIIFDSNSPYHIAQKYFNNFSIETIFKPNNYKNGIFIFTAMPLLNLIIFDYKFIQINTIIDLINPIIPFKEILYYSPYIYEIKEINNNKIMFYGSQKKSEYYKSKINKYDFKIIFNYERLNIEFAENISFYDERAWE